MISGFLVIAWMVASRILLPCEATPANNQDSEECNTPACQEAARYLLDSMDPSVDPCQDFYRYSCGGWFEKHPIPEDRGSHSAFSALDDEVTVQVAEMLKNAVNEVTHPRVVYDAANLFLGCLDEDAREAQGLNPLKTILNSFGGWPMASSTWSASGYQWQDQVAKLERMLGITAIITVSVDIDLNHTSRHIIGLSDVRFGLGRNQLVNMTASSRVREIIAAYRNFIITTAKLINPNVDETQVAKDADEIIQLESALARLTPADEETRDASTWFHKMTIAEAQRQTENTYFEWTDFLNELLKDLPQVTDETEVILYAKDYIKNAIKLIHETNPRVLANYFGMKIVFGLGYHTTKQFRQNAFQLNRVLRGVEEEPDMEKICKSVTIGFLKYAVGRLYIDKYFSVEKKRDIEQMVEDIRSAYRVSIMDSTWMDTNTRDRALEKLDSITARVGYPNWIKNDTELNTYYSGYQRVERDEYFRSVVQMKGATGTRNLRKWTQPVDPNAGWAAPTTVNAYYYPARNTITFPAGILNPPFYGYGSSPALNFGAIGATIGHEIGHAFDDEGSQYDKDGNLVNWWSKETKEQFNRRADCFKDQYSSYVEPLTNMKLNANNTIGEDIGDNVAIRNTFVAFKFHEFKARENEWMKHKTLPGITATPDQLFFLGYGTTSCDLARKESMENSVQYDNHSPDEFRVLVPLSNSQQFAEAFNCPVGSPMNPASKCILF